MAARRVGCVLLAPVWLVVLFLLALVLARIVAFDGRRVFVVVDAYTLWIYLPAYVIVVAALCFRARALAVAAAVVVVAHLAWVLPPVFREVAVPAAAADAPRVRVMTANLLFDNREPAALLDEIAGFDADVIVLEEVDPEWWAAIAASGLLRVYAHHVQEPMIGGRGMAMLSRIPLGNVIVKDADGWPVITATIRAGEKTLHLVGVHATGPAEPFEIRRHQHQAVTAIIAGTPRPRIVPGDFNVTPYNRWYDELLGLGLREAHEAVGQPFATTWPNGQHRIPPIRIDHVFADPSVIPLRVRHGTGPGSDHKPVVVDFAVLPSRRSPSADR